MENQTYEMYSFVVFAVTLSESGRNGQENKLRSDQNSTQTMQIHKQRPKTNSQILLEKNNAKPHPKRIFLFLSRTQTLFNFCLISVPPIF